MQSTQKKAPEIDPEITLPKEKKSIATISLAGCFGCHMSLLDIDLKLIDLVEIVELNKSPAERYQGVYACSVTSA